MARTFVTMFVDSGTYSGRVSNILSQMGGWPVYIFSDAVVFMTMPGRARVTAVRRMAVDYLMDELVSQSPGHPGPNKAMHESVREAQQECLAEAVAIFEAHGIDHVTAHDIGTVSGAVVVVVGDIKAVHVSRTGVLRRAVKLTFEMCDKDPDVPFYERTRHRRYTLGALTPRDQMDGLVTALRQTFGERLTDNR